MHEGVAWNVIQRRQDGSVDFYRPWSDYKQGFGSLDGEFWIGNKHMHYLTSQTRYMLKIDMWDWKLTFKTSANALDSNYFYAESSYFRVGNESEYFKLHVPESFFAYSGYSGSGLRVHSGPFMTYDVAIPRMRENCAVKFHCGWWFTTCVRNANLNGRYYSGGYKNKTTRTRAKDDIYWPNIPQSLKKVQMRIARMKKE
ncbi:hypothetical protein FSP39_004140 [Pinctada imbricata]|uniref:Fibrinogen C-terminal domain-containing protein n=1 Tax=Pinctada imbricata TaxID=66713 RepID=A0AA88YGY9_PINIB|nr:hypothetical protein FSP39_004140 [Pinctada imbricata]